MKKNKGFTLIELLIVIAIIAIIAAVIFVALNPVKRFQDSRNAVRYEDVRNIIDAIKLHQIDNGGYYLNEIASTTISVGTWYMITDGGGTTGMTAGCDDAYDEGECDAAINADTDCVDLDQLVTQGYLGGIPISPAGVRTWDDGKPDGDEGTGYAFRHNSNGSISVQACESEGIDPIIMTR